MKYSYALTVVEVCRLLRLTVTMDDETVKSNATVVDVSHLLNRCAFIAPDVRQAAFTPRTRCRAHFHRNLPQYTATCRMRPNTQWTSPIVHVVKFAYDVKK